jgi:hypothetical protein
MDAVDSVCAGSPQIRMVEVVFSIVAEEDKKQAGLGSLSPQANNIINIYQHESSLCSETPKFVCT